MMVDALTFDKRQSKCIWFTSSGKDPKEICSPIELVHCFLITLSSNLIPSTPPSIRHCLITFKNINRLFLKTQVTL